MNIPKSYEALAADLASEKIISKTLQGQKESYMMLADGRKFDLDAIQQRLTVAEKRESEAREELLELSRNLDVFYSRSHGIKNLSEIEKANDKAKDLKLKVCEYEVLLNISKELLTTISRHRATTKPVDWCDSFKAEVADRIEKIGAALKPAADAGFSSSEFTKKSGKSARAPVGLKKDQIVEVFGGGQTQIARVDKTDWRHVEMWRVKT